jgi:hypothetical protein
MIGQLSQSLPSILKFRNWSLAYSTKTCGSSTKQFFRLVEEIGPSVLVIKAAETGYIFGAFASESWRQERLYYGSGDCFLYTFQDSETLECFYATRKNEFYMLTEADFISLGAVNRAGLLL